MARVLILSLSWFAIFVGNAIAQLSPSFYSSSCPHLLSIVRSSVRNALVNDPHMGASLLRLFFLDCFVNGCDGSILLDDTPSFTGEKNAIPNKNSVRGFDVIDEIKTIVENVCPTVVSCADILAIAARDSVDFLGGLAWNVRLGRRDAITASQSQANNDLPSPTSTLSQLISRFNDLGLSNTDLVALSGGHTIGAARCTTFRDRIYNDTNNIDSSFARARQRDCPRASGSGDNNLTPLDLQTPNSFDNIYFKNLLQKKGLLQSDQVLLNGGSTDSLVKTYANVPARFLSDFAAAMVRMGNISPLTGSNGEIRQNCRRVNSN